MRNFKPVTTKMISTKMISKYIFFLLFTTTLFSPFNRLIAQKSYFIDGYHGGIWGHFPYRYSSFIADEMQKNPGWKLNLEIEPVTWDSIKKIDPTGYGFIQKCLEDSSANADMEYVNPAYGQSYMFNISAESIIRQFQYGIKELKIHFPNIRFTTYSSEEPCFTSSLPSILRSFGFKYASLKNPNTCWGGYVQAHGGELINWVGPDGSSILTVPRYQTEKLQKGSTWQTNAWKNSPVYIQDALNYGIKHPVGMCIQDAGWRNGPWLGPEDKSGSIYTTWRNYFENIATNHHVSDWHLSQEDIKVSLVWGSQILQRVAKAVRKTENALVNTEAVSTLNHLYFNIPWPQAELDKAWKSLLLSEHHDCWIVPNNRKYGRNWQSYVDQWTSQALHISDSLLHLTSLTANNPKSNSSAKLTKNTYLRIYNSTGRPRKDLVSFQIPADFLNRADSEGFITGIMDKNGLVIPVQTYGQRIYFEADIPTLGFSTYELIKVKNKNNAPIHSKNEILSVLNNGDYQLQTDLYTIRIDPKKGGMFTSLLLKAKYNTNGNAGHNPHEGHEFLGSKKYGINELRGYFYNKSVFHSSQESAATIKTLANGPLFASLQIDGKIAGYPFEQIVSVSKKDPLITTDLHIDWPKNAQIGIGHYDQSESFKNENPSKAFYNSRYKLLTLFPVNISHGSLYRDAPFDIFKSQLNNTFYDRWDSIKNDIMLHWVNLDQKDGKYGFALFSDETTSYAHTQSDELPLGLTTQYSGKGLFGADYNLDGSTSMRYAIMPHGGDWKEANVNAASENFNNPLTLQFFTAKKVLQDSWSKSLLNMDPQSGWTVSSLTMDTSFQTNGDNNNIQDRSDEHIDNNKVTNSTILLRIFNATGNDQMHSIHLNQKADKVQCIQLNGDLIRQIPVFDNGKRFQLAIPHLGFTTVGIKLSGSALQKN